MTQLLPSTAQGIANRAGMAYRPDLLRAKTAEGAQYQYALGRKYFEEGLRRYGGNLYNALRFYHGGPDSSLWGPKTNAYASSIMSSMGYR